MPWDTKDATRHTKKARTPKLKRMWQQIANSMLARDASERAAIRGANSQVAKRT